MTTNQIITVTLNPSLDRTLVTHFLAAGYANRTTESTRLDPAGRGVNLARALHALHAASHSVILLGNDGTGYAYEALVRQEGFPATIVRRQGLTRSNVFIVDSGHHTETQLIEESTGANEDSIRHVQAVLDTLIQPGDAIVLAGSLPNDTPPDVHARLAAHARERGAKVIADVPGDLINGLLAVQPDLLALTRLEAEGVLNYPVRTQANMIQAGGHLIQRGPARVLMLDEDPRQAVLVAEEGAWVADFPAGEPIVSRAGVKEAILAGYLAGLLRGEGLERALTLGVSAAAYTASQIGNEFGTLADVRVYSGSVDVQPEPANTEHSADTTPGG